MPFKKLVSKLKEATAGKEGAKGARGALPAGLAGLVAKTIKGNAMKKGGMVKKPSDAMGRAVKRKTADVKGRAMKKGK